LILNGIKDTQAAIDAAQCVASSDPRLKLRWSREATHPSPHTRSFSFRACDPRARPEYVLEGAVISQLDDQPPQSYATGQMWSEAPHQRHMVSKNASATAPAKLLVFMIAPHGQKLTDFLHTK
jgi:hypothetical protein